MYRSLGSSVTGSPSTTANGISDCSGSGSWTWCSTAASRESPPSITLRSGLVMRSSSPRSAVGQAHRLADVAERLARDLSCLVAAFRDDAAHQVRVVLVFLRALPHPADLLDDALDHGLLALEAAD